jgi:hypothetical protein
MMAAIELGDVGKSFQLLEVVLAALDRRPSIH